MTAPLRSVLAVGVLGCAIGWAGPAAASDIALNQGAFGTGYNLAIHDLAALLAFIAIGVWSAMLGGSLVWQLPVIALGGVALASLVAEAGVVLPYAQQGLLAAPLLIGILVMIGVRIPLLTPPLIVALVAVFEGFPVGAITRGSHVWPWLGYDTAALLAMAGGLGLAGLVAVLPARLGLRALGAAIALASALMLLDKV
jgi:hydrogenase/urease accessory protein HupE